MLDGSTRDRFTGVKAESFGHLAGAASSEETELSLNDETHPYERGELIDWNKIEEIGDALSPSLRIPSLPDDFADIVKCSLDELSLVIWLSDPSLKIHQAVQRYEPSHRPVERIEIPKKTVDSISWSPNCMLGISLVLARSRGEPVDGSASRAGQWVSQKVFRISSEDVGTELPIVYVDDEEFARRGYPRDSIYVIEFDEGASLNESVEVGGTLPFTIYFSSLVLSRLLNPNAPAAKSLAAQFNAYAVTEILRRGIRRARG